MNGLGSKRGKPEPRQVPNGANRTASGRPDGVQGSGGANRRALARTTERGGPANEAKPLYQRPSWHPEGEIPPLARELDPGRFCTRCGGPHAEPCPRPGFTAKQRLENLGLDTTFFGRLYASSDLPGVRDVNDQRLMRWKDVKWPGQELDIDRWLPIYADGIREPEPLRQSAVMGFCAMVAAAHESKKLLTMDLAPTALALRNSLSCGDAQVIAHTLVCLKELLSVGPGVARELARRNILRGLLVVPSRMQHKADVVTVGYAPPQRVQLRALVNEVGDLILGSGGAIGRHCLRDTHLL